MRKFLRKIDNKGLIKMPAYKEEKEVKEEKSDF
jgi:hypothetical protein